MIDGQGEVRFFFFFFEILLFNDRLIRFLVIRIVDYSVVFIDGETLKFRTLMFLLKGCRKVDIEICMKDNGKNL